MTPSAGALTDELTTLNAQLSTASAAERPRLERHVAEVARVRRALLEALIQDEPETVLQAAMSSTERARLPGSARRYVETAVQEEGELEVLIEDRHEGSQLHHRLRTDRGERLSLHFAGESPHLLTGTRVRVNGVRLGEALALAAPQTSSSLVALSAIAANTFGEQRTLVILVNFQDNPAQPYTPDAARQVVFGSVSGFDWENSYHQTWLSGDVAGWYTIPMSSTVCDTTSLASYANAAASAGGYNLSAYTRLVYGFPDNACTFWGLGTVGGQPSSAWINGEFSLRVVAHEMGHNFGLYHAHSLDCGAAVIGSNCTTDEYGDTVDIMGAANSGHFSAFQKERLGWLAYAGSPPIVTVTTAGSYWLEPYETTSANTKALKILKSTDPTTGAQTWYYLEYRQAIGTDSMFAGNTNILNGVVVHTGSESTGNSSNLLDMTAGTGSWADPALAVGLAFSDTDARITVNPVSSGGTGAMVSVSFLSTCTRKAPTVTLTPATAATAPGGSVNYAVVVKNNDSSACAAANFALQATAPTGWTKVVTPSALSLGPGASGSAVLKVVSPLSAVDGAYGLRISATSSAAGNSTASATASYVVARPLSVTAQTDRTYYTRYQAVTVSGTVRNTAGKLVSNASVKLTFTKANGTVVTAQAVTSGWGTVSFRVQLKTTDPAGTYRARLDAAYGSSTGTATAAFAVR